MKKPDAVQIRLCERWLFLPARPWWTISSPSGWWQWRRSSSTALEVDAGGWYLFTVVTIGQHQGEHEDLVTVDLVTQIKPARIIWLVWWDWSGTQLLPHSISLHCDEWLQLTIIVDSLQSPLHLHHPLPAGCHPGTTSGDNWGLGTLTLNSC